MTTKKREQQAAKRFDAKPVPASGATPWAKEDFVSADYLFQHKQITKTHTIHAKDLEELRRNAVDIDKYPAYVIATPTSEWVMVPKDVFDLWR